MLEGGVSSGQNRKKRKETSLQAIAIVEVYENRKEKLQACSGLYGVNRRVIRNEDSIGFPR